MGKHKKHLLADEQPASKKILLNQIFELIGPFAEGKTKTKIPFLSVVRRSHTTPFAPGVLTPSFCLMIQAGKRIQFGQNTIDFGPGDFAASVIDFPATGQIINATKNKPYLGLLIDFTTKEIASVITEAAIQVRNREKKLSPAAFVGKADIEILEMFVRLLKLLDKPEAAQFVSSLIKREMIFHLLSGEYGYLFFQNTLFDPKNEGVGNAIEWIRKNYKSTFTVEDLAKENGMSVSGLHHKFKMVTTMGPLQYQKHLRLQEARRLMLGGQMDATRAALEVGYESPSQFNREYRRLFGLPPLKDMMAMRKNEAHLYPKVPKI